MMRDPKEMKGKTSPEAQAAYRAAHAAWTSATMAEQEARAAHAAWTSSEGEEAYRRLADAVSEATGRLQAADAAAYKAGRMVYWREAPPATPAMSRSERQRAADERRPYEEEGGWWGRHRD